MNLPEPFLVLAPMDDVTDVVFRQVIDACTPPDMYFTEFVNVDGLQSVGREKLLPRLLLEKTDKPVIAQIWGKNPENFYKTASELEAMGFSGVDINFGCPDKTVVKNNTCSAMIKPENRERAVEIIQAVKKGVGDSFPVSVKTRLGFNEIDFTWHELLLNQGIDMLTVHFRTRSEMSKVPARWDKAPELLAIRDKVAPKTKIVGNGDVMNREHAEELVKKCGVDGVMIGRGVFHDPFCFSAESPWADYSKEQKLALFRKHLDLYQNTWTKGERRFETIRKFAKIYINGFDGASELRAKVMVCATPEEVLVAIA
jgi:tRNA-dihydrouridine synthase